MVSCINNNNDNNIQVITVDPSMTVIQSVSFADPPSNPSTDPSAFKKAKTSHQISVVHNCIDFPARPNHMIADYGKKPLKKIYHGILTRICQE